MTAITERGIIYNLIDIPAQVCEFLVDTLERHSGSGRRWMCGGCCSVSRKLRNGNDGFLFILMVSYGVWPRQEIFVDGGGGSIIKESSASRAGKRKRGWKESRRGIDRGDRRIIGWMFEWVFQGRWKMYLSENHARLALGSAQTDGLD